MIILHFIRFESIQFRQERVVCSYNCRALLLCVVIEVCVPPNGAMEGTPLTKNPKTALTPIFARFRRLRCSLRSYLPSRSRGAHVRYQQRRGAY